jgi:serine/threonine-protein phosphatase 2A regulatory subunit B''
VTVEVCGLPKFFQSVLFDKIDSSKSGKINKQHFITFFKRELEKNDVKKRMFRIIAPNGVEYITAEDFKPLFR